MFRDIYIYGGICVLINNLIHRRGSPTQMMDSPQLITVLVGQRPESRFVTNNNWVQKEIRPWRCKGTYCDLSPIISYGCVQKLKTCTAPKNTASKKVVFWNSKTRRLGWPYFGQSHVDPGSQQRCSLPARWWREVWIFRNKCRGFINQRWSLCTMYCRFSPVKRDLDIFSTERWKWGMTRNDPHQW